MPGHFEDHWVCQYWHASQARWVMVDFQLDALQQQVLQPDFDPLLFEYKAKTLEQFGRKVPSVVAVPIDEDREREIFKRKHEDENRVLYEMLRNKDWTFAHMAEVCGFVSSTGKPLKSRVHRTLGRLLDAQLVKKNGRRGWHLTGAGEKEAQSIS